MELNQNWSFRGIRPDGTIIGPYPAEVPGCVHTDLLREGVIADSFWRDSVRDCQWIEETAFIYECRFPFRREGSGETLIFEGADTIAEVFLNGSFVGRMENMHLRYEFDVSGLLQEDGNLLEVKFEALPNALQGKDLSKYDACFSSDRPYLRRMQCTFGWDWVERMVTYGLWRPVYLSKRGTEEIVDLFARTVEINAQFASVAWVAETSGIPDGEPFWVSLTDPEGNPAGEYAIPVRAGRARGVFRLDEPQLWWPAGYGGQPLYRLTAHCHGREYAVQFGVRTAAVEEIPDSRGSSYTVIINGERVFAKGGNWVPCSPFPSSVTREKYGQLLSQLVEGNMNMLRVWGGGTYERPEFWEACDRLGILVSLDFMMACASYPEEEGWFLDTLDREARCNIRRLRNHPSLIFYNGNNELAMNDNEEDSYGGKRASALVLQPAIEELDPSRQYFPTSPYRGRPFNSPDAGDCHISAWYDPAYIKESEMRDYRERIAAGNGRFLSECCVAGMPPLSTLQKMMTEEDLQDGTGMMLEFHTKDNPYKGYADFTHYQMMETSACKLFGPFRDLADKVRKMEYLQYEYVRLQAENYRRRKYDSSGILFWMYNDCWPASGWALVDYYGQPKAGFFGAKKAFAPLLVSIENREDMLLVWVVNDTRADFSGVLAFRIETTGGERLFEDCIAVHISRNTSVQAAVYSKERLGLLGRKKTAVVYAELRESEGAVRSDTVYFEAMPYEMALRPAKVEMRAQGWEKDGGTLTFSTDCFARMVTVEGEFLLSDNYFDLLPGMRKTITCRPLEGNSCMDLPIVTWMNL